MKRILFVDDEQNILDGLRGLLRKQRKVWEMTFLPGGEAALQELLASPCDVIVSDMRMPGMDGASLLRRVMDEYPHVVRIVLSGQGEQEVSRRMVHVAHQFMAKPCEGRELQQIIERAINMQALLELPELRHAIGRIGQLPGKPSVYGRLVRVLENPDVSVVETAAAIEQDAGTSAKLLELVNSAPLGLPRQISEIETAISYLGIETIKALALSVEMRQSLARVERVPGYDPDAAEEHALLSGRVARRLLSDRIRAQDAFSAALLADIGALVLMGRLPDLFREMVREAQASSRALHDIEMERLGVTHAEIGAYLLAVWGLPYNIVEAVALHHHPDRAAASSLGVVGAVHVASCLVQELRPTGTPLHLGPNVILDKPYLAAIGALDHLPEWRGLAEKELRGG